MSAPDIFMQAAAGEERAHREQIVRLNVEQASYAYSANAQAVPTFTLGATSFHARMRNLSPSLKRSNVGKSTLLRLITGTIAPLSGRGGTGRRGNQPPRRKNTRATHCRRSPGEPDCLPRLGGRFCAARALSVWTRAAFCESRGHRHCPQRPRAGGCGTPVENVRLANFPAEKSNV